MWNSQIRNQLPECALSLHRHVEDRTMSSIPSMRSLEMLELDFVTNNGKFQRRNSDWRFIYNLSSKAASITRRNQRIPLNLSHGFWEEQALRWYGYCTVHHTYSKWLRRFLNPSCNSRGLRLVFLFTTPIELRRQGFNNKRWLVMKQTWTTAGEEMW